MNIHRNPMRRTKIMCTIGPAIESIKLLEDPVKSESGTTARLVSRHGPNHPIIALSPNQQTSNG